MIGANLKCYTFSPIFANFCDTRKKPKYMESFCIFIFSKEFLRIVIRVRDNIGNISSIRSKTHF